MLMNEIKRKKYKNEKKCRNYVIRNLCLECLLEIVCNVFQRMIKVKFKDSKTIIVLQCRIKI